MTLALSTNDQGKAWLNGKQVFKFAETRTLEKDTDAAEVTLTKGQNVLVLKVINEVNNWQALRPIPEGRRAGQEPQGLRRAPVGIARGRVSARRTLRAYDRG